MVLLNTLMFTKKYNLFQYAQESCVPQIFKYHEYILNVLKLNRPMLFEGDNAENIYELTQGESIYDF